MSTTPFWEAAGLAGVDANSGGSLPHDDGDDVSVDTVGPCKAGRFRLVADLDEDECWSVLLLLSKITTTQRHTHLDDDPVREASEAIGASIVVAMTGGES